MRTTSCNSSVTGDQHDLLQQLRMSLQQPLCNTQEGEKQGEISERSNNRHSIPSLTETVPPPVSPRCRVADNPVCPGPRRRCTRSHAYVLRGHARHGSPAGQIDDT